MPRTVTRSLIIAAAVALSAVSLWAPSRVVAASPPAPTPTASELRTPAAAATTDRVLIRWTRDRDRDVVAAAADRRALVASTTDRSGANLVRLAAGGATVWDLGRPLGDDADQILEDLRAMPGVQSVEPDLLFQTTATPNDPFADDLWGLAPADATSFGIDALGAWPTTRGAGVRVAVIDSGFIDHPDMAGRWLTGYDFISDPDLALDGNGRDANAHDPGNACPSRPSDWHGSHVAGTIGAIANNGIGVFGGAPDVRIQPVRTMGACGSGYLSDISDAIRWAAGGSVPGVPANATPSGVLNLSLGGVTTCPSAMSAAIADARSRGAVVVVSAGNEAIDAAQVAPANCPHVISVAATSQAGQRASFSDFGASVDVAAPGVGIVSTIDLGNDDPAGPGYAAYSGTSMAAPHVSVAAALVRAAVPGIAPQGVELVLQRTVTPFPSDPSPQRCAVVKCGAGIVDAGAAIARLLQPTPVAGLLTRSTGTPAAGATFTITAHAVDRNGIHFAQYRVGTGIWQSMSPMDGGWGEPSEDVRATVTAPTVSGSPQVCIRVFDEDGHITTDTICTTIVVDATAPTLILTRDPAADLTDAPSVTVTASWSESVKGFTASDVSASGGSVSGFAGSGASYHWTVTRDADGPVSSTVRAKAVTDAAGNPSGGAVMTNWLVDRYGPFVALPTEAFFGSQVGMTSIPVRFGWSASDAGSGVASVRIGHRTTPGGVTTTASTDASGTLTRSLPFGVTTHRVSAQATDGLGHDSDWRIGPTVALRMLAETDPAIAYAGSWSATPTADALGGAIRGSSAAGATATATFHGRDVAWIAWRGPIRGSAQVWVDGALVRTVDLYAAATTPRLVVFQTGWSTPGTHTIRIVVLGTPGHARVDLDGFAVLE